MAIPWPTREGAIDDAISVRHLYAKCRYRIALDIRYWPIVLTNSYVSILSVASPGEHPAVRRMMTMGLQGFATLAVLHLAQCAMIASLFIRLGRRRNSGEQPFEHIQMAVP